MYSYHDVAQWEGQGRRLPYIRQYIVRHRLLENQGRQSAVRTAHTLDGNSTLDVTNWTVSVSKALCWFGLRSGAGAYKQSNEYLGLIKRELADVCSLPEVSCCSWHRLTASPVNLRHTSPLLLSTNKTAGGVHRPYKGRLNFHNVPRVTAY
jgi:hypothetical protein